MSRSLKRGVAAGLYRLQEIRAANREAQARRQEKFDQIFGTVILPTYLEQKRAAADKERKVNDLTAMGIDRDVAIAYTANPNMFPGAEDDLSRLKNVTVSRGTTQAADGVSNMRDVMPGEASSELTEQLGDNPDPMMGQVQAGTPGIAAGEELSLIDKLAGRTTAEAANSRMMDSTAQLFGISSEEMANMFSTVYGAEVMGPQITPGTSFDYEGPVDINRVKDTLATFGVDLNDIDVEYRDAVIRAANSGDRSALAAVAEILPTTAELEAAKAHAQSIAKKAAGDISAAEQRLVEEMNYVENITAQEIARGDYVAGTIEHMRRKATIYRLLKGGFNPVSDSVGLGATSIPTPAPAPGITDGPGANPIEGALEEIG